MVIELEGVIGQLIFTGKAGHNLFCQSTNLTYFALLVTNDTKKTNQIHSIGWSLKHGC